MGSNQTTVAVSGAGAAIGTVIAIAAKALGVDVGGQESVVLGGAVATLVAIAVGYFHKPAPAE